MDYDTLLAFFKSRRSIRQVRPEPIPDDYVEKMIEAARWAPSGQNLQPWEFLVVKDLDLRIAIKTVIDEYKANEFLDMEATREAWQYATRNRKMVGGLPLAPVFILLLGDPRSMEGLPMAARYTFQKKFSIFDSSLSNAFLYMLLAAHSLDLAAFYVSAVKYPKVGARIRDILHIPNYLLIYDMLLVGRSTMAPSAKVMREREEIIHYDQAGPDEFRSDERVREQILQSRSDNMHRHQDADKAGSS